MIEATSRRPGLIVRLWDRHVWAHAALLLVLLVGAALLISPRGNFSSDEGAPLIEAKMLAEGQGWTMGHPLSALDPDGSGFYLSKQSDGGPVVFAPFGKHPLYPLMLVPITQTTGQFGAMLLSALGTLGAAFAAWRIALLIEPRTAKLAFWATGLFSPLFFDAHIVIAHALGAALCGWATWFALMALRDAGMRRSAAFVGAGALTAGTVLLRTEGVLYALALGGVLAVHGVRGRRWGPAVLAAFVVGGAGLAAAGERLASTRMLGAEFRPPEARVGAAATTLAGRVDATVWTLFAPTGARFGPVAVVSVLVVLVVVAAAVRLRQRPTRWNEARILLGVAAVVATVGIFVAPDAISGILPAFPVFTFSIVLLRRRDVATVPASILTWTCGTFLLLVLATTYDIAGAAEWGARFLAIALPAAIAVAVQPIGRLVEAASTRTVARDIIVLLLVIGVAFSVIATRELIAAHDQTTAVIDGFTALLDRDDVQGSGPDFGDGDRRPVVLTEPTGLGRTAWERFDDVRGLVVDPDAVPEMLDQLDALGTEAVILYSVAGPHDRQVLESRGWDVVSFTGLEDDRAFILARPG